MAYIPQSGSVVAFQSDGTKLLVDASVAGTVGASIIGYPNMNVGGSVVGFQGTNPWIITGSVQAVITPAANQSVSGTVGASIIGTVPVSIMGGTIGITGTPSISGTVNIGTQSGSVVAFQGTTPWVISSVYGNISGSVAATITNTNVNVSGSVVGFQGGTWAPSAIGYVERNDGVASYLGANLTYRPLSGDSAGRVLTKPFAADDTARLDTVSSTVSTSVTALFSSAVGLRNYVTDIMIANTGTSATLVTFKDGSTSILGFTIAPAGGGSNINGMAFPLRTAPAQDFVYVNAIASSVLYVTAKGYQAP